MGSGVLRPNSVLLKGRKGKYRRVDVGNASSVAAGATSETTLSPTSGHIARVVSAYLDAPSPGSTTSGDHTIWLYISDINKHSIARVTNTHDSSVGVRGTGERTIASSTLSPSGVSTWQSAVRDMRFTNTEPLVVQYKNNTDQANASGFSGELIIEEFPLDES